MDIHLRELRLADAAAQFQWMNDPETGPVMLQISRIFQTLNRT